MANCASRDIFLSISRPQTGIDPYFEARGHWTVPQSMLGHGSEFTSFNTKVYFHKRHAKHHWYLVIHHKEIRLALSLITHQEVYASPASPTIPNPAWVFFLELYPDILLLDPADKIQSGIGGVSVRSPPFSSSFSLSSFSMACRMLSKLS